MNSGSRRQLETTIGAFLLSVVTSIPVSACASGHVSQPNAPEPQNPSKQDVEALIDEMLKEERAMLRAREAAIETAQSTPPVSMPEIGGPADNSKQDEADTTDTFPDDILRIQEVVPTWSNGTGIALKFLREATGARVSLIYVDPTPPEFKPSSGLWMIQAAARTESQTLGHFVLLLKSLSPGRYQGSSAENDVIMSTSMGPEWNAEDPDTTWSVNEESWCEIVLTPVAENPGVLEGHFKGKLVDNQGTGFHRIESGYIYIKR